MEVLALDDINNTAEKWTMKKGHAPRNQNRETQIKQMADIRAPSHEKEKYLKLLYEFQDMLSLDKTELGRCNLLMHEIHLKTPDPVYIKQFKIPQAHQDYLKDQVRKWLKLGIVQNSRSRFNSPLFLVTKKDGGFRVVQDFRALNAQSYVDKYSMKDVTECIDEIGRSESTIFTTLDLTSGFWQMLLHPQSRPYTAFMVPGMG
jgi:hypothetical protein